MFEMNNETIHEHDKERDFGCVFVGAPESCEKKSINAPLKPALQSVKSL